jgi:beta-glucosidase
MEDMSLRGAPGSGNGGITYQHYSNTFGEPLWPFGHGESFSTFAYRCSGSEATTASTAVAASEDSALVYSCTVANTGEVASDVVVLGWVSSNTTDAPLTELFAFGRATALAPGKTAAVDLTLAPKVLALVDATGTSSVRPGEYRLRVGGDSAGGGCRDERGARVCAQMGLTLHGTERVLFSMAEAER